MKADDTTIRPTDLSGSSHSEGNPVALELEPDGGRRSPEEMTVDARMVTRSGGWGDAEIGR